MSVVLDISKKLPSDRTACSSEARTDLSQVCHILFALACRCFMLQDYLAQQLVFWSNPPSVVQKTDLGRCWCFHLHSLIVLTVFGGLSQKLVLLWLRLVSACSRFRFRCAPRVRGSGCRRARRPWPTRALRTPGMRLFERHPKQKPASQYDRAACPVAPLKAENRSLQLA